MRRLENFFLTISVLALTGCASISQFPDDPGSASNVSEGYQQYFDAEWITTYETASADKKDAMRDTIVINRMLAYDESYENFKKELLSEGNSKGTLADLAVLALSGFGATMGGASA